MAAANGSMDVIPLSEQEIKRYLKDIGWASGLDLYVHREVDSTNQVVRCVSLPVTGPVAVVAESQTHGRGRRGRRWVSSFGKNVLLSLSMPLCRSPGQLAGLSLAAGVSVVDALERCGVGGVALKWPNDLVVGHSKLGGLLIEVDRVGKDSVRVVIGLGLNVWLDASDKAGLSRQTIDLKTHCGRIHDRNELVAVIIACLCEMLEIFEAHGFESFRQRWEQLHVYRNKVVTILSPQGRFRGIAQGVDGSGRLALLSEDGAVAYWDVGEVSLRG